MSEILNLYIKREKNISMIGDVVSGRILELNARTCRAVFVGLKLNAKDSGA